MTQTNLPLAWQRLAHSVSRTGSLLCCGIDPDLLRMPKALVVGRRPEEAVLEFARKIIDVTKTYVCAYKIQKAYFDLLETPGQTLASVVQYIHSETSVPVIIDAKIGDTEN